VTEPQDVLLHSLVGITVVVDSWDVGTSSVCSVRPASFTTCCAIDFSDVNTGLCRTKPHAQLSTAQHWQVQQTF